MNALGRGALAALASLALHGGLAVATRLAAKPPPRQRGPALQVAVVVKPKPPEKPPEPPKPKPPPRKPPKVWW